MNWKRTARWSLLILPFLLLAVWPSVAAADEPKGLVADVVLYEVWEDVFGTATDSVFGFPHLDRVAAISGYAKIDTLVCTVAKALHPSESTCTVNAVGTNHIQLDANNNPVSIRATGDYAVVDQLDNRFDSPERVITRGTFSGTVYPLPFPSGTPKRIIKNFQDLDFLPLLRIVGSVTVNLPLPTGGQVELAVQYTGTFRLPFGFNERGEMERRPGRGHETYYLSDTGRLIKVGRDEMSLGYPTPRLELTFGQ